MKNPVYFPAIEARAQLLGEIHQGPAPDAMEIDSGDNVYTATFTYNPPYTVATVTWGSHNQHVTVGIARCNPADGFDGLIGARLALARALGEPGPEEIESEEVAESVKADLLAFYDEGVERINQLALEQPVGTPEGMMEFGEAMGRGLAHEHGDEWAEDGCPTCERKDDCPILKGFLAERAEMADDSHGVDPADEARLEDPEPDDDDDPDEDDEDDDWDHGCGGSDDDFTL